jgi:hypothetical protein
MGKVTMVEFTTEETVVSVDADEKTLIAVFGLTPMEARFFQAMLKYSYGIGPEEMPEISYSLRQMVYNLRAKLRRKYIRIMNAGGGRYTVMPDVKNIVKRELENSIYSGE